MYNIAEVSVWTAHFRPPPRPFTAAGKAAVGQGNVRLRSEESWAISRNIAYPAPWMAIPAAPSRRRLLLSTKLT